MDRLDIKSNEYTLLLRNEIDEYVKECMDSNIPRVPFSGFLKFIEEGERYESEAAYFERRKQLVSICLYLQYHEKCEEDYLKILQYFEELLWEIVNEVSWCVIAHLPQDKNGFTLDPCTQIDLFAAETGAALAEVVSLHSKIIHPFLINHIKNAIDKRIFKPFLLKNWWWETVKSNWCSVCCGSIGMAALLMAEGDIKAALLNKVEHGLVNYLESLGNDGVCEEGVGYWVYGFGYYFYYIAMRKELEPSYDLLEEVSEKIIKIARFPYIVQMDEKSYVPFSDVSARAMVPTGLLSYLYEKYGVNTPAVTKVTPLDFDNGYRFAHISRNLWWTNGQIFHKNLNKETVYLNDKQWLIQRSEGRFFAIKGGNNEEQHNHNDVGSFVVSMEGEQFITDLGAGPYTADYFSEKRYEFVQTRSRYHNLPLIKGLEQVSTRAACRINYMREELDKASISMELALLYDLTELISFNRRIQTNMTQGNIILEDIIEAKEEIVVEEGFISYFLPQIKSDGAIEFAGMAGCLILTYDHNLFKYSIEEVLFKNHYREQVTAYRLGLLQREPKKNTIIRIQLNYVSNTEL